MKTNPRATRPRQPGPAPAERHADLPLPHEHDESVGQAGGAERQVMVQAKKDLDAGQVDTDLRATPGLDAARRETLLRRGR